MRDKRGTGRYVTQQEKILLLFGGGMTLAKGMETTGLIDLIGNAVAQNQLSKL